MCYSPLHIVNPSTWFDPYSGQPLYIDVPCGHCSECINSYRNEWRNRAYYESLDCFTRSDNSYILFDTLTYRNGNLPHLSDWLDVPKKLDFPCFNHDHLVKFIDLLRTRLRRSGYEVSNSLRYFIGCEYGDDIRFTRRPHYHVLFFVTSEIPPIVLSKFISECWIHGRTDGVSYRGRNYVLNECVFTSMVESERFSVNYVTKYCTKDFSYNNLVKSRLDRILSYDFDLYQNAKEFVKMNHYQSKSFGHDAMIRLIGRACLLNTGRFKIIQKNGLFRYVNLHKSLQRKLLYDYHRRDDGSVYFTLNSDGFTYKKKFYSRSIDYLLSRVAAFNTYKYIEIKSQVYDYLFVRDRCVKLPIEQLIDSSYNVVDGLRNYSSVDYSFMRKRIFTSSDYGCKRTGFVKSLSLSSANSLDDLCSNSYITLSRLKQLILPCNTSYVDNYLASKSSNGDYGLDVLKLKHRLEHVFKIFDYV